MIKSSHITDDTPEKQHARHKEKYRLARLGVFNVIKSEPPNLANSLNEPLQAFFFEIDGSIHFRQRFFLGLAYINLMRGKPFELSDDTVDDVISEFVFAASRILKKQKVGFLTKSVENALDSRLIEDSVKILSRMKVKPDRHEGLSVILNIDDPTSRCTQLLYKNLELLIPNKPRIVFSWIRAFQLLEFMDQNLKKLALTCHLNNLDIGRQLFVNDEIRKKVVMYLDKFSAYRPPITENDMEREFLNRFTNKQICGKVYEYANDANFMLEEVIPITVGERKLCDYQYQLYTAESGYDKDVISIQALKPIVKHQTLLKRMYEAVKRHKEDLAKACAYYMGFHKFVGLPDFELLLPLVQNQLKLYLDMIREILEPKDYVDKTTTDDFQIYLVDDETKFNEVMGWLMDINDCAFDIEANFVVQSSNSTQQASLLQLADNAKNVFIMDLFTLKTRINHLHWLGFFGAFFRPRMKRIGFDINNDIRFLQATFPQLREYLAEHKPAFHDIKRLAEAVTSNLKVKEVVFGNNCPDTVSLGNLIMSLLNIRIEKGERVSNWEVRPLKESQMIYAANDAYYSMKCFKDMQRAIYDFFGQTEDGRLSGKAFLDQAVVIPTPIGKNSNEMVLCNERKKETFDDVFQTVSATNESLKSVETKNAGEVFIVVDAPLLKVIPLLRRCGYPTFDHREVTGDVAKKAQIQQALSEFVTKHYTANGNMYFLSNRYPFTHEDFAANFRSKYIQVTQEQTESSIIEAVMLKTRTVVDAEACATRCVKCFKGDTSFEFPIHAFRLCYRSYATFKEFYDKKFKDEDPQEMDEKDRSNLDAYGYIFFENNDKTMVVYKSDQEFYKFEIDGASHSVKFADGKVMNYKPETRLYEHESLEFVRFCKDCAVFF